MSQRNMRAFVLLIAASLLVGSTVLVGATGEPKIYLLKVKVSSAYIRSGPSLQAPIIAHVTLGDVVEAIDMTGNWHRIKNIPGSEARPPEGYIHESVVEKLPEPIVSKTPEPEVNVTKAETRTATPLASVQDEEVAWIVRKKGRRHTPEGSPMTVKAREGSEGFQTEEMGVMAGIGFSKLAFSPAIPGSSEHIRNRIAPNFGIFMALSLSRRLNLQPELLFVQKGYKLDSIPVRISYLEVPILLRMNFMADAAVSPHLFAGPYVAIKLGTRIGDVGAIEGIRLFDSGLAVGIGTRYRLNGDIALTLNGRYDLGLIDISRGEGHRLRTRQLSVFLGAAF